MKELYCQLRKTWVAAQPEEIVRQNLVAQMVSKGYPMAHIVLEKALKQMPHLQLDGKTVPNRRADIVCFANEIHPQHALYPLLLVECKAVPITKNVLKQVVGYNHVLQAYFVAVANAEQIQVGWFDKNLQDYKFIDHLPEYQALIKSIHHEDTKITKKNRTG